MDITEIGTDYNYRTTWVKCPFDDNHIMSLRTYYRHVVKCKDKHPESRKIPCRFNAFEYVLPEHMDTHIKTHHASERNNILFCVGFNRPILTAPKETVTIDDDWVDEDTLREREEIKKSYFLMDCPGVKHIEKQYDGKNIELVLQSMNPQLSCARTQKILHRP